MSGGLKPCPFCGSAPELLDGGSVTSIRCSSDQCISRPEPFNDWGHRAEAIAAWNRRAPAPDVLQWVPVSERLPSEHVTCALRLRGDYITIGWASYWHGARTDFARWNFPHDSDEDVAHEITHWMPLPAAPSPQEQT